MTALCRATVDTLALNHNLRRIRKLSDGAKVLAVIKANAYGHGLVPVAKALCDADALAVARIEEAVALRAAGVGQRLVLLEGVFNRNQLELAAANACDLVVHSHEQLELLESFGRNSRFTVWLKIDTGMNRLGFRPEEFSAVLARLRSLHAVREELVLMTHLANADVLSSDGTRNQLALFEKTTRGVEAERSIANSAGLLSWPESRAQWVRPGLALFGVSPIAGKTGEELGLKPVMRLGTELIAIRKVAAGESAIGGEAFCHDQSGAGFFGPVVIVERKPAAHVGKRVLFGAHGHAVGIGEYFTDDVLYGFVLITVLAQFDEICVFREAGAVNNQRLAVFFANGLGGPNIGH